MNKIYFKDWKPPAIFFNKYEEIKYCYFEKIIDSLPEDIAINFYCSQLTKYPVLIFRFIYENENGTIKTPKPVTITKDFTLMNTFSIEKRVKERFILKRMQVELSNPLQARGWTISLAFTHPHR